MDTLPSTRYHSAFVERFNADARREGRAIDLTLEGLLAAALAETGRYRFRDESFLPALQRLLSSLEAEADLNPFGRFNARTRVIRSLKTRLQAEACYEAHPEILRRTLRAPIVIVGPHRSGTTRLQRMLAADDRLQYLRTWEGFLPAPRLDLPDLGRAERRAEVEAMMAAANDIYPGAFTAHAMEADAPEEEMLLLNHAFCSFSLLGLFNVPSYYRWFLAVDKTSAYRDMTDLLRLISWSRGDEDKPWVLKNPQHMHDLDVLMKMFPDAKVVFTHRDPLKTVGSMMSLAWYYTVQNTDAPCRAHVREVWLDFCERLERRCMEMRNVVPAPQQIDVQYEDMNRDWRGQMRRIYDFAGIEYTPAAEQAQAEWLTRSSDEKQHGSHRYALKDFGVTREEVDARMAFVRERYGIPYEGHAPAA